MFVSEKHVSALASVKKICKLKKSAVVEKIFDFQNSLTVAEKLYDDGGIIANDETPLPFDEFFFHGRIVI